MKAVDFIVKHIDENGMTQSEAAAVAGMSRQNFWDKLNNRNPRFNTMTRILDAFGYQIHVARKDREPLNFCEADFFTAAEKENLYYDSLEAILFSMDYVLEISKKAEE